MKGSSKVIMGATLITVLSLAMVLGLVLVLLAELYCSLLLRRRQLRRTSSNMANSHQDTTTNEASDGHRQHQEHSVSPSLSSFYSQGVLCAPRSLLFPSVHVNNDLDLEKQQHSLRSLFCESQTQQHPSSSSYETGHAFSLPASPTFIPLASPRLVHKVPLHCSTSDEVYDGNYSENYIYICNPIYDNDGNSPSRVDTPFETPDSSPSRLEIIGEDDVSPSSTSLTPPLTPMKKLPAEACSVSLRDARSLATSGSDSNSNICGISSSTSSGSPCTSPSW